MEQRRRRTFGMACAFAVSASACGMRDGADGARRDTPGVSDDGMRNADDGDASLNDAAWTLEGDLNADVGLWLDCPDWVVGRPTADDVSCVGGARHGVCVSERDLLCPDVAETLPPCTVGEDGWLDCGVKSTAALGDLAPEARSTCHPPCPWIETNVAYILTDVPCDAPEGSGCLRVRSFSALGAFSFDLELDHVELLAGEGWLFAPVPGNVPRPIAVRPEATVRNDLPQGLYALRMPPSSGDSPIPGFRVSSGIGTKIPIVAGHTTGITIEFTPNAPFVHTVPGTWHRIDADGFCASAAFPVRVERRITCDRPDDTCGSWVAVGICRHGDIEFPHERACGPAEAATGCTVRDVVSGATGIMRCELVNDRERPVDSTPYETIIGMRMVILFTNARSDGGDARYVQVDPDLLQYRMSGQQTYCNPYPR